MSENNAIDTTLMTAEQALWWKEHLSAVATPPVGDRAQRWEHRNYAPRVNGKPVPRRIAAVAHELQRELMGTWVLEESGEPHVRAYFEVFGAKDAGKLSVETLQRKLPEYVDRYRGELERRWYESAVEYGVHRVVSEPVRETVERFTAEQPNAPTKLRTALERAVRRSAVMSLSKGWKSDVMAMSKTVVVPRALGYSVDETPPLPSLDGWNPQPIVERFAAELPQPVTREQVTEWSARMTVALEKLAKYNHRNLWDGGCDCMGASERERLGGNAVARVGDSLKRHFADEGLKVVFRVHCTDLLGISWSLERRGNGWSESVASGWVALPKVDGVNECPCWEDDCA